MSEENIDLTRCLVHAFNGRDIEGFIEYCDPEVEYHSVFAAVGGAVYRGLDEVRRFFGDLEDAWGDEIHVEPEA